MEERAGFFRFVDHCVRAGSVLQPEITSVATETGLTAITMATMTR